MIVVVSAFRNSERYIERYFEQIDALQIEVRKLGQRLFLILGYGDCLDHTQALLHEYASHRLYAVRLVNVSHGGPAYGSIVHRNRFKQLAFIGNLLWQQIPQEAEYVSLIESDLIWEPKTFLELLATLTKPDVGMVAPMVYDSRGSFYDTWAFRIRGIHFMPTPPYFPVKISGEALQRIESVGSYFVMRGELARQLSWPEKDVVVGVCKQVRDLGKGVYVHRSVGVQHP